MNKKPINKINKHNKENKEKHKAPETAKSSEGTGIGRAQSGTSNATKPTKGKETDREVRDLG